MSKPLITWAENRLAPLIEKQWADVPGAVSSTPPCLPRAIRARAIDGGATPPTLHRIPVAPTPFRVLGAPQIEVSVRRWAKGSGVGGVGL